MGTGIVAIAAVTLPLQVPGLRAFALAVWVLAAALLVVFSGALAAQWIWHRERALAHAANPVMAQFWGAPAMALMTVGGGTLLIGRDWLGLSAAVNTDWALWGLGTALGLITACWIPYLMMTRHEIAADGAFGGWLMPVVPPMVAAANGALLVPFATAGQARLTLLAGCYAMFGISLFASLIIMPLVWSRLVTYKTLPAIMVPTCWILLGPLGQSVTAAGNLARVAGLALHPPYPAGADVFALLYGLPTWGFAILWLAIAAALTVRAVRGGMPFGPTWWSFTFPVGTVVTGTISLAARTGSEALRGASLVLFVLLAMAWLIVLTRTAARCVRGEAGLPPRSVLRCCYGFNGDATAARGFPAVRVAQRARARPGQAGGCCRRCLPRDGGAFPPGRQAHRFRHRRAERRRAARRGGVRAPRDRRQARAARHLADDRCGHGHRDRGAGRRGGDLRPSAARRGPARRHRHGDLRRRRQPQCARGARGGP
jgi:C4-dicarboxylate transporter/malic acid transport protein